MIFLNLSSFGVCASVVTNLAAHEPPRPLLREHGARLDSAARALERRRSLRGLLVAGAVAAQRGAGRAWHAPMHLEGSGQEGWNVGLAQWAGST